MEMYNILLDATPYVFKVKSLHWSQPCNNRVITMTTVWWWLPTRLTGCDCSIDHNLSTLSQSSSLVVIQVTTFPHPTEGNTELAPNGAQKEGWERRQNGRDQCVRSCASWKGVTKSVAIQRNLHRKQNKTRVLIWPNRLRTCGWKQDLPLTETRPRRRANVTVAVRTSPGRLIFVFVTRSLFRFVRVKSDAETPPEFWLLLPLGAAGYIGTPTGGWVSVG